MTRKPNNQEDWKSLLEGFSINPPAEEAAIRDAERDLAFSLPSQYCEFLRFANGGEGFVGSGGYVALWRVEQLCSLNKEYKVDEYAPGLLLFGSDGGGEGFAFDRRSPHRHIVQVPFIPMGLTHPIAISPNFSQFFGFIAQQRL